MHTLIISAVFPPEPVVSAKLSEDLASELSLTRDVVVLCPQPTRPEGFNFSEGTVNRKYGYNLIRLNSFTSPKSNLFGRFYESYSFGKYCVNYIKRNRKDINCIYLNSWPLLSQYLIVKTAKKYQIPCVIHVQDIYPETLINKVPLGKTILNFFLLPIDKYCLENSKHILCISEKMKSILEKTRNISNHKISVVTNWQDEEDFITYKNLSQRDRDLNSSFTFMYLGNNGPIAGVDFLIKGFFNAKIPNSKLIIAGSGSRTDDCKKLVQSLNAINIEFIPVPDGNVPEIQDMADVMLLPVKKNAALSSIPSKLPAYMFSSKPIIGSLDITSDTAKAIIEAECGIVVEPENETELIRAMKQTVNWGKQILDKKGNAGFEYGLAHFSKKVNLQKVIKIIGSITE